MKSLLLLCTLFLVQCATLFPEKFKNWPSPEEQYKTIPPKSNVKSIAKLPDFVPQLKPQVKSKIKPFPPLLEDYNPYVRILLYQGPSAQTINLASHFKYQNLRIKGKLIAGLCGTKLCIKNKSGKKRTHSDSIWIEEQASTFTWRKKTYRGGILLKRKKGRIQLINKIPMEEYLKGVLPYEIGVLKEWGTEALKAQAIAARTYTYKNLAPNKPFDLYADTRDQVYNGIKSEYPLSNQAIQATSGLVLTYKGSLINAYYHSTSAGFLASKHEVWGGVKEPYLMSHKDLNPYGKPWSYRSKYSSWKKTYSWSKVTQLFKKNAKKSRYTPSISFNKVRNLEVVARTSSGRVKILKVKTDNGSFTVHGDKTRWLFQEKSILPSAWFSVITGTKVLTIKGKGFGHGIGLDQMGARERSRKGQSYKTILSAYYRSATITKKVAQ